MRNSVSKYLCITGSILLLVMAIFHGSGINYVNSLVQESDVSDLIKRIFHVLFILPTIQLIGFAIFGIVASFMKHQANRILVPLASLVLIDAFLGFYLGAVVPGIILMIPSVIFGVVAYVRRSSRAL